DDLRSLGSEADTVYDEGFAGAPDEVLIDRARIEQRVLLTMDKGIADVRAYPPELYAGIVLIRPPSSGRSAVLEFIRPHLPLLLTLDLAGHVAVISEAGARVR